jgi:hypothetical protein
LCRISGFLSVATDGDDSLRARNLELVVDVTRLSHEFGIGRATEQGIERAIKVDDLKSTLLLAKIVL